LKKRAKNVIINDGIGGLTLMNHLSGIENGAKEHRFDDANHLIRQRLNVLLKNAVKNPVLTVCAGAGCGKTRAVSDFLRQQEHPFLWMQISERDNSATRYWENLINSIRRVDETLADKSKSIGFPDTMEKIEQFLNFRHAALMNKPFIIVLDDFHLLKEPSVLFFTEKMINNLSPNLMMILICRDLPKVNIEILHLKGFVSEINEADLNFTEIELLDFLKQHGLSVDSQTIRDIHKDTGGWAFAANLVARSLKKVPMYPGFVKTSLRQNLFKIIEAENWDIISEPLKRFLVKLSLIDRISAELVYIISGNDNELLNGLKQHSAYIRFDNYGGAYLIHHLYLDFLQSKQYILTDEERLETYKAAANWCNQNNFKMDALNYYEKVGDYETIVSIFWGLLGHTSYDFAFYTAGIFERAPAEVFDRVDFFAAMHLYNLLCLVRWKEFFNLAVKYEQKLLSLPEDDTFRNNTLGIIYFFWGFVRFLLSTMDDRYDFDAYYIKAADCLSKSSTKLLWTHVASFGAWFSAVGSSKKDAPQQFLNAVIRTEKDAANCIGGANGTGDLCRGELKFYQGDLRAAEPLFFQSLEQGRKNSQQEIMHRSLFYIMRIAVAQGDRAKAEQTLRDLRVLLEETNYSRRFITYDIALGWYYCVIRQFGMVPDCLKSEFTTYGHAYFINNFGNQITARYYYLKRNFLPLLIYIKELKQRESVLYGRVEMLAMEACVHYQMKNKPAAWVALKEAYETAAPNDIIMPFIELSKDMRTLIAAALREQMDSSSQVCGIPRLWLESIKHKATSYAKNQSMFINEHKTYNSDNRVLSAREHDVLSDLYHGFSQSEIASKRSLSINTVKMITKGIYEKLHVHKISDLIRIAAEQRLV